MRFDERIALVAGGSQGIGAAIALHLANDNASVAVMASSNIAKAQGIVDRLPGGPAKHMACVCNVREAGAVNALVADVAKRYGKIDILINSAGVFFSTPAGGTTEDEVDRMIDINLKGAWNLINAVVPGMAERNYGKIINVSSVAGVLGVGNYALYSATKGALIMMTRALANEVAGRGINVNCLAPGNTATPMNEDIRTKPEMKPFLEAMTARTPSGRTYSSVDDMAQIAAFLASDAARAMHGSCVLADEGFSAGI
jgi:NAD(P)-dependent dehydrogenase (short-subunit alcohol dehydrogenase family)